MSKTVRVALVTGGAVRVGRAIVEGLHAAGFRVAFTFNRSREEADELLKKLDAGAVAIRADLTKPRLAVEQIFKGIQKSFGRLDVLVNSASIYEPGEELRKEMMAIHAETPLLLCRRFEGYLRKSHGRVVNMVDLLAERPLPKYAAYAASKAALWNQTISLARELAPQVTVNGIAPGVVAWPPGFPESQRRKYLLRVPLRRAGTPQDVSNLVRFLVTDGGYITGQIIRLDGGRSIT